MGLFEHFPYTNFHELNLDWLLRMMKELEARMDNIDGGDIAAEIADIIQQMIRDGSMAALLAQIALDGRLVTGKNLEVNPQQPAHMVYNPDLLTLSSSDVYDLYDAMISDQFIKTYWGVDEDGKQLNYYTWICNADARTEITGADSEPSGEYAYSRELAYTNNGLILTSGIHGNEKQSVWALYHVIRAIVNGEGPLFKYIRDNVNIVVMPCVNPWGMDQVPAVRQNSRTVDLNRNFPYAWDAYNNPNYNKGTAAASEKGTQFVIDVVDSFNDQKSHNGVAIIDFHDFFGSDSPYDELFFLGSATNPEYRIALSKAGMQFLDYMEDVYPSIIEGIDRPIRVTNIGSSTPTYVNWAFHQGFRYTQLHECRTFVYGYNGGDDQYRYSPASNNMAWQSICLSLGAVATMFVGGKRLYNISSISELGLTSGCTLQDLCTALPPRSRISTPVYSGGSLYDDMPGTANGLLTVESGNWSSTRALSLTFQTFSVSNSTLYVAAAWGPDTDPATVSNWQEIQPVTP